MSALMDRLPRVLVLLTLALDATWGRAGADEPVLAVWKERQAHFSYRGMMTAYPCGVLRHRIALILASAGARPDVDVTVINCDFPLASAQASGGDVAFQRRHPRAPTAAYPARAAAAAGTGWPETTRGPDNYRRIEPVQVLDVRVRLSMPAGMTPELIAELEMDRRRRELITRVTGDVRPLFDDPIPFIAKRQVFTISRETIDLEPADCELLDQMSSTILRELGVRVVRRGYTCDRGWRSRIAPTLEVEALVPVGFGIGAATAPAPVGGSLDPPLHGGADEEMSPVDTRQEPE